MLLVSMIHPVNITAPHRPSDNSIYKKVAVTRDTTTGKKVQPKATDCFDDSTQINQGRIVTHSLSLTLSKYEPDSPVILYGVPTLKNLEFVEGKVVISQVEHIVSGTKSETIISFKNPHCPEE